MREPPITVSSHRNNKSLGGWLGLGLAVLCFLLARYGGEPASSVFWLHALAVLFALIGALTLIWAPRRIAVFDPARRCLEITDLSRFGKKTATHAFQAIESIHVSQWHDPDPDIRPLKRVLYCVVVRLHSGAEIGLTDQADSPEAATALAATLNRCLREAG